MAPSLDGCAGPYWLLHWQRYWQQVAWCTGLQLPLRRRIPKRGFHNPTHSEYAVVNVESLDIFPAGTTVTPELLIGSGLIRQVRADIKVLGDGELKNSLTVQAHKFSKSAAEKIAAAGGKAEILS